MTKNEFCETVLKALADHNRKEAFRARKNAPTWREAVMADDEENFGR